MVDYVIFVGTLSEHRYARVVELVDTLALGASAFGREGSSPFARTKSLLNNPEEIRGYFIGSVLGNKKDELRGSSILYNNC